jgi:adenylate cyclase
VTGAGTLERLTEAELADRSGATLEHVRELVQLGILQPDAAGFTRRDVVRTRVIVDLAALGIEAEALAKALVSGHLTLGYLESAGRRHPRSDRTFNEVAEQIGVSFEALERLCVAFGLPRPEPDERIREEDLEAMRFLPVLLGAGLDERDVLRLARVWGDSVRRVAQYLPHYFHTTIEEQFRRRGLRDNEAYEAALREVGVRIGRSGEDLLGWLFRRHSEVFLTTHQYEHVETALDEADVRRRPQRQPEAAVFADLSGYTQLTEASGDEAAAEIALSFAQLAGEVAAKHRGSVVKLLGDGAYLHFWDPAEAVRASLELAASTASRGLPPVHVGVDAGSMLYDEGDYFGRTVNLAARIAAEATAGQVLVGEAAVNATSQDGFRLEEVGDLELKGIAKPMRVFEAIANAAD